MTGIIDVGGGQRAIFGAGVLDRCLADGISFDLCIGVSAGSANVASFLGGQQGRNYRFYTAYARRKEYMSMREMLRHASYINLNYIYGTLSDEGGEDPLDYQAFVRNPGRFIAVSCDAQSGEPVYFSKKDLAHNHYEVLNASCAMPVVCRPQRIGARAYYDGGVVDPVPIRKALEEKCDKLILILTRPLSYNVDNRTDRTGAALLSRSDPVISDLLRSRSNKYKEGLALAASLQREKKCLILSPSQTFGVKTVTKNPKQLDALYRCGYEAAAGIGEFLTK